MDHNELRRRAERYRAIASRVTDPQAIRALEELAAALGSDIPFFLHNQPALAVGRGEKVAALENFPALRGKAFLLAHPGFGISTPWSYQNLARFPEALNGQKGRAQNLIAQLQTNNWPAIAAGFYNSLEAPALDKFPVLKLYQEFLAANGALVSLMLVLLVGVTRYARNHP